MVLRERPQLVPAGQQDRADHRAHAAGHDSQVPLDRAGDRCGQAADLHLRLRGHAVQAAGQDRLGLPHYAFRQLRPREGACRHRRQGQLSRRRPHPPRRGHLRVLVPPGRGQRTRQALRAAHLPGQPRHLRRPPQPRHEWHQLRAVLERHDPGPRRLGAHRRRRDRQPRLCVRLEGGRMASHRPDLGQGEAAPLPGRQAGLGDPEQRVPARAAGPGADSDRRRRRAGDR